MYFKLLIFYLATNSLIPFRKHSYLFNCHYAIRLRPRCQPYLSIFKKFLEFEKNIEESSLIRKVFHPNLSFVETIAIRKLRNYKLDTHRFNLHTGLCVFQTLPYLRSVNSQ